MKSSQRLYKKCRLFRSCPQYHAPRRTVFYTVVNCDPVQGQGSSRRRRLRPVLRHLPAVALRPAALGLVAGVAAVPGGGRHGPARHRQLQRPLRRPGLRLRLRRAVLRRRVLLLRRRRPQPARVLVAAVRRRAPRVQPVFLQVALDLVVGEPVHLHQLSDLLRRGDLRAAEPLQGGDEAAVQPGRPAPPRLPLLRMLPAVRPGRVRDGAAGGARRGGGRRGREGQVRDRHGAGAGSGLTRRVAGWPRQRRRRRAGGQCHERAGHLVGGGGGAVGVGGAVVVATAAPELHGAHPAALVVGVRVRQDGSVLCRRRRRWWREEVRRAAAVLRELLLEPVDHVGDEVDADGELPAEDLHLGLLGLEAADAVPEARGAVGGRAAGRGRAQRVGDGPRRHRPQLVLVPRHHRRHTVRSTVRVRCPGYAGEGGGGGGGCCLVSSCCAVGERTGAISDKVSHQPPNTRKQKCQGTIICSDVSNRCRHSLITNYNSTLSIRNNTETKTLVPPLPRP